MSLSQWATSLSGRLMSGWMAVWTDGWMDVFIAALSVRPSSATVIQSIYTDQFLFLCARVTKLLWYVAASLGHCVWELANRTIFLAALFFQSCILLLLIQSKNSNGAFPGQVTHKWTNIHLQYWTIKWDFYLYKNWIFVFISCHGSFSVLWQSCSGTEEHY